MESTTHPKKKNFSNQFSKICFIAETQNLQYKFCKLKHPVESVAEASYSPILTLGAYLLFHHNQTQPPRFQCEQISNGKVDLKYPSQELTVNNFYEIWNDYLSNLVVESKVYQEGNTLYFMDFVSENYIQNFNESEIFEFSYIEQNSFKKLLDQKKYTEIIQHAFGIELKIIPKTKKFAAICFSEKNFRSDRYLPKIHIAGLFFGIFYRETDEWKIYRINEGDMPSVEELEEFDAVLLSGSGHSVYENIPEINCFMERLVLAYQKNLKLKILGFCFGHQSIAYHFGGKVKAMKKKFVGLESIRFDSNKIKSLGFDWFNKDGDFLERKEDYLINEFHSDEVVEVPEGFSVIGSSLSCAIEALSSDDGRCLSYQFHIEYTPEYTGAFELRILSYDSIIDYKSIYRGSSKTKSCVRNRKSTFELREISRKFIESELN